MTHKLHRLSTLVLVMLATLGCALTDELRIAPDGHLLMLGEWPQERDAYYESIVAQSAGHPEQWVNHLNALQRLGRFAEAVDVVAAHMDTTPEPDRRHLVTLGTMQAHAGRHKAAAHTFAEAQRRFAAASDKLPPQAQLLMALNQHAAARDTRTTGSFFEESAALPSLPSWRIYDLVVPMLRVDGVLRAEAYRYLAEYHEMGGQRHMAWLGYLRAIEEGHPDAEQLTAQADDIQRELERDPCGPPRRDDYDRWRSYAHAWLEAYQAQPPGTYYSHEDRADGERERVREVARVLGSPPRLFPALPVRLLQVVSRPTVFALFVAGLTVLGLLFWFLWRGHRAGNATAVGQRRGWQARAALFVLAISGVALFVPGLGRILAGLCLVLAAIVGIASPRSRRLTRVLPCIVAAVICGISFTLLATPDIAARAAVTAQAERLTTPDRTPLTAFLVFPIPMGQCDAGWVVRDGFIVCDEPSR